MHSDKDLGPASAGPAFDFLALAVRVFACLVLTALVLLVCGEAFLRGVANYSLGFAEEVTGYFVVALTLLGAALALRAWALFQVHFLIETLPAGVRILLLRIFIIAAFFVCAVLAWKTTELVISSLERGKFAPTVLRTPLWIPQLILPIGFVVIGIFLIEQLLLSGRKRARKN